MEAITHSRTIVKMLYERMERNASILDVGAGDRRLKDELAKIGFAGTYKSVDIDPFHEHDFAEIDRIEGTFDCAVLFDFIEHVHYTTAASYLGECSRLLADDGFVVISTPNIDHYNCLWRTDMTHCQQYPLHHLYALLRLAGFEGSMEFYRVFMTSEKQGWKRKLLLWAFLTPFMKTLRRFSQIDFAQEILVFAYKE